MTAPTRTSVWRPALRDGFGAFAAVFVCELLAALGWLQGATEAGLDTPIDSSLRMFPGSAVRYQADGGGFLIGWTPGYLCLLAGAAVVLARVWRLRAVNRAAGPTPGRAR